MKEKMQLASDASYLERSNLQQILQKHRTLESELSASAGRVEDIVLQGKNLTQDEVFPLNNIEETINEIQNSWNELKEKAKDRGRKLQQASDKKAFDWSVEDFTQWLANVEKALASPDLGEDLNSLNSLIKKQGLLEADIVAHRERLNEISRRVEEFQEAEHFQLEEIRQNADDLTKRYEKFSRVLRSRLLTDQISVTLCPILTQISPLSLKTLCLYFTKSTSQLETLPAKRDSISLFEKDKII